MMKQLFFVSVLFASISTPAFANTYNDVLDIRRMIATSLMRQQGRNLLGTDKNFPGQRPPISDDLKPKYCLITDRPETL